MRSTRKRPVAVRPAARRSASSARRRFPAGPVWQRMATLFMRDYRIRSSQSVRSVRREDLGRRERVRPLPEEQRSQPREGRQKAVVLGRPLLRGEDRVGRWLPRAGDKQKQFYLNPTPLEPSARIVCWMGFGEGRREDAESSILISRR